MTGDEVVEEDELSVMTLLPVAEVLVITRGPPGLDMVALEEPAVELDDMLRILIGVCFGLVLPD